MDKVETLKRYFGHTSFREGQEGLVDALLNGQDALGIMPTGGGKSICYQLPALMQRGVALVISPLISLMKDQVMALQTAGISAAVLNSSLTGEEMREVYRGLRSGRFKLVYVAPERLEGEGFVALARELELSLVAVDEAHCISQWGQDFRPSYLRVVDFLEKLPRRPPVAAFTATATKLVREDIEHSLKLREPYRVITGFDRPNLSFEVLRPKSKGATLRALVAQRPGRSGIVYCATRNAVESVCGALRRSGVPATRYHAGLSDGERRQNQEEFLYDRASLMVATNAFGMGIDKSNVSFVIHYNMPKSLEAYYQEAGRAGRDGERAECILLYSARDVQTAKFLIQNGGENGDLTEAEREQAVRRDYERLAGMVGYCKSTDCLRAYILDYFGQAHGAYCGNCGSCRARYTRRDITREAQMILSCVKRAKDHLGYSVGAALIIRSLSGSGDKRVRELELDRLSTYGLLKGVERGRVREYLEYLESEGYLHTDPRHGGISLTAEAGEVLFRGRQVELAVREETAAERRQSRKKPTPSGEESGLFPVLRTLRARLAQEEDVPAYVVFSNATLADMAARRPGSMAEFLEVSGVGEVKARRYGKVFLAEIAAYEGDDS